MSLKAVVGLLIAATLGLTLSALAQEKSSSSGGNFAPVINRNGNEPLILPNTQIAKPLNPKAKARIEDGAWRPVGSASEGLKKVGQAVAAEYAQVAAQVDVPAGDDQPYTPPVPSVPLGAKRKPVFGGPSSPAAPLDENGGREMAPIEVAREPKSILKRPGAGSAAAVPTLEAPVPGNDPREDEVDEFGDRVSSRRIPRATVGRPSNEGPNPTNTPAAPKPLTPTSIREMTFRSMAPQLRLETRGPQAITLGKETRYYFDLFNEGEALNSEVQVRILLPATCTLEKLGDSATVHNDPAGQRVMWTVSSLEARGRKTLELRLVATEGKSLELAVDWAFRPPGHKAQIAVRQPQLQVAITGPGEMSFGEEKAFRVTVSNVGTGDAESVSLNTAATGNRAQKFDLGLIPAGQQKEFTVTLVANQPGEMEVQATVLGEGEMRADSASKVLIRRAELAAVIEGPPLKYSGSQAAYAIAVGNSGNSPANDVQLSLTLPAGAKYLGGIEGATANGNILKWRVGQIPAGTERNFEANIQLNAAGDNRIDLSAQGSGAGVAAATNTVTKVEALADLKLVVNDPAGPFATGGEVTYELQIMNRGTNVAKQLKIVMHFSEGIEPSSVEGAQARIVPGQVVCEPLAQLEAGEKVAFKVKARGESAGNHLFRVEVFCTEPETRLVSEGTTRFFVDSNGGASRIGRRPGAFQPQK